MPVLRSMVDGETAHNLSIKAAKYGLMPRLKHEDHPELKTKVWGMDFASPLGLAAGFDKHGEAVDGLFCLGFAFAEIGSVTPIPQEGNPKPRVFRLPDDQAVINRYGFNSEGHEKVFKRLEARTKNTFGPEIPDDRNMLNENLWSPDRPKFHGVRHKASGILGVNLGKNKTSVDAADDYVKGVKQFGQLADFLVINISSPNTPGLRALQSKEELENLLEKVLKARDELTGKKPPLLIKLSPDLSQEDKADIATIINKPNFQVDGLVISNTTISRPATLKNPKKLEVGGLSGPPVRDLAMATTRDMYQLTQGKVPIIGVGGISSGQDAYDRIKSGASLVEIYTVLVYDGPPAIKRISDELAHLLKQDGFNCVSDAVGVDVKLS